MFDIHGTGLIDTSSKESMLEGIADMIIMYDQISCKGVAAINGLFEEGAQKRGIPMCRVRHDLLDPTSVSRREMRNDVNIFMQTVMKENPVDASLLEFDDDRSW